MIDDFRFRYDKWRAKRQLAGFRRRLEMTPPPYDEVYEDAMRKMDADHAGYQPSELEERLAERESELPKLVIMSLTDEEWSTVFVALDALRRHNLCGIGLPPNFYQKADIVWEHLRNQVKVQ